MKKSKTVIIFIFAIVGCGVFVLFFSYLISDSYKSETAGTHALSDNTNAKNTLTSKIEKFEIVLEGYRNEDDFGKQCAIVNSALLDFPDMFLVCSHSIRRTYSESKRQDIAHFASAYHFRFKKQDELKTMVQTDDIELAYGLLLLLRYAVDIDANNEWHLDRPLGGPEMPSLVAQVATRHPKLSALVASVLGVYGGSAYQVQAKREIRTILTILLSDDEKAATCAFLALFVIDQSILEMFSLDSGVLTKQQKESIQRYLADH